MIKKITLVAAIVLFAIGANAQFKFKGVGGGLALGSNAAISKTGGSVMGFGIYVNGLAQITEKIDAEASLVYYFPSEPVSGFKFRLMTFNVNGHYNFFQKEKLTAYGLAGLNLSVVKVDMGPLSSSDSRIGLNIGVGGTYGISSKLDAVGQLGYTLGDADQLFINLGVVYKF